MAFTAKFPGRCARTGNPINCGDMIESVGVDCKLCKGAQIVAKDIVIADHALGHKRRVINLAGV